ncbi:hypothetical protein NFI96_009828 [Prochilodus magdalenae]|nr:hypothetical protein NFI96_009828 [Prochilodus magdalenae]
MITLQEKGKHFTFIQVFEKTMSSPGSASAASGGVGNGRGSLRTPAESEEGTDPLPMYGTGHCKWFNVRMGFGFISMTSRGGTPIDPPLDVFVHQSKLHMEGFRSLKEGEAVEFTFKKSSKGLECVRVTGPGGVHCVGSEKRPKGKSIQQKRKPKGDRLSLLSDVTTVVVWTIMPKSVASPHNLRSATTARVPPTWWHTVHTKRLQLLREGTLNNPEPKNQRDYLLFCLFTLTYVQPYIIFSSGF